MKRVLLTGASGFIGRHCVEPLLARGYEVHSLARHPVSGLSSEVVQHPVDLLNRAAARDAVQAIEASHLLHLAWFVVPGQLISSPENFNWVTASLELVRDFRRAGGRRVMGVGSCYEYDWRYGYCSEALTPLKPDTVYGACKNGLRELTEAFCRTEELSWAWARVFFLYGPHEHPKRLVSSVIRALLSGEEAPCSHGRQIRDYMHVQDVADGLVALLDSDLEGPCNIASGQAMTLREIVSSLGDILGSPELVKLGALPARANDAPLVVADIGRQTSELGWEPRFGLREGLEHTCQWWRENL